MGGGFIHKLAALLSRIFFGEMLEGVGEPSK